MNNNAASSLIHHLDEGNLKVGKAPQEVQDWLNGLGLEINLLRFMQWAWPQTICHIGPMKILSAKSIPMQDDIEVYLRSKLLPIGSGPNGDTFAIDYSVESCPVGFVTHEEYDGTSDPREFFRPAARSIESFLFRIAEGRYFPCDYYEAGNFNDFLRPCLQMD